MVPAHLGPRVHRGPRGGRGRADGRALLPVRVRALRRGPGDQLHPDRGLLQLRRRNLALDRGSPRARSPAPLRARLGPAGRRRRLPLRRVRPSDHRHVRRRRDRLPVPDRSAAGLPAAGRRARAARQAARRLPGRPAERPAANARPARPDDRAAQRRRRPLLARDRRRRGPLRRGAGARPHGRASCTTSASSSSPTGS